MTPRWGAPLAIFAGLLLLAGWLARGHLPKADDSPSSLVGKPAPAFDLPHLHDPTQRASPQAWLGRVWVLNVWASWCAPCKEEHPLLVALARQGGVTLVGLNFKDDPRNAQEWLRKLGNPYLATLATGPGDSGAGYGVHGLPLTLVIDQAGVVRHQHLGLLTPALWQQSVLPVVQRLAQHSQSCSAGGLAMARQTVGPC
jgi:cytochrome c biogenesis protein CcmG/thiol:disulfide interchange protein DsbE